VIEILLEILESRLTIEADADLDPAVKSVRSVKIAREESPIGAVCHDALRVIAQVAEDLDSHIEKTT
jgi:hypothetical protein